MPAAITDERQDGFGLMRILFSALFLLQLIGAWVPGPLLWGGNHLAYLPAFARILVPLLGLAVIWTPLAALLGRLLIHRVAPQLFGNRWIAYGFAPVAGTLLFWILRVRLHCLGDGWLLGEMVGRGVRFHGFDFLAYLLHGQLYSVLGLKSEPASFQLFAVVSTVTGGFYLAAAAWGARTLSKDPGERLLLYGLLLFTAPILMFMGYVETYGLLSVCMLLFLIALARHYRDGLAALVPASFFALGLICHLDALFLAPLLAVMLFLPSARAGAGFGRRALEIVVPLLAVTVLAAAIYQLAGYSRAWFNLEFVQGREGKRLFTWLAGSHGVFSLRHWKDMINLAWLLIPTPVALLGAAWIRRHPVTRAGGVLLAGSAFIAVLSVVLHMKLGVPRDWDLFAAQTPVFVLAAVLLWSGRCDERLVGLVTGAALLLVLPWVALNTQEARSLDRFRDVMRDQPMFARSYTHEEIAKYHRKCGEMEKAVEEYRICTAIFPRNPRLHGLMGAMMYNLGRPDEALTSFHLAVEVDSTDARGIAMLARLYGERNELGKSIGYSRRLAGRREEGVRAAAVHGTTAERLGLADEAIEAYKRAVRSDGSRVDLVERIGGLALSKLDYPLAEQAFRTVLHYQPDSFTAGCGLVFSIWAPLREQNAAWQEPPIQNRLREAHGLATQLLAKAEEPEPLRTWHRDIENVLTGR